MPEEKEEDRSRMLYCQLDDASTKETGEVKMSAVQLLNKKHSIDINLSAELGHTFGAGGAHHNLGSHFDPNEKLKFKSAQTTDSPNTSTYQRRGTGVAIRGPMTQHGKYGN